MAHRYTKEQRAQALILLAANRGKIDLTASQLGISSERVRQWAKEEKAHPSPELGMAMETSIQYLLSQIPTLVNKYNIGELLGTLLEKWLQYQGIPQNSTQTILAVLATKSNSQLDNMIADIEEGRQFALNSQDQIIDMERQMISMGMVGNAERGVAEEYVGPRITKETPAEVIDLIQYGGNVDDDNEDTNDW